MSRRAPAHGSLGVTWHLPGVSGTYQRWPFADTTVASADLIRLLAGDGLTWSEIAESIVYDFEARNVAEHFVAHGYGDIAASQMVAS